MSRHWTKETVVALPLLFHSQNPDKRIASLATTLLHCRRVPELSLSSLGLPKMRNEEQSSRLLNDLCVLLFTVLRSPPTSIPCAARGRLPPLTPWSFASLMLGISLTLMLSGSVTFVIGCVMMPWILGMLMLLFFIGFVSSISVLWKMVLGLAFSSPPPPGTKNFSK